jgi:hypothetical protein
MEGSSCISKINSTLNDQIEKSDKGIQRNQTEQEISETYELRRNCFIITNLYVYSLFGVIIGGIILVVWYTKYKQIWTHKSKKIDK